MDGGLWALRYGITFVTSNRLSSFLFCFDTQQLLLLSIYLFRDTYCISTLDERYVNWMPLYTLVPLLYSIRRLASRS